MNKLERLELEEQSFKAFGSKTKYKKLMERGRVNDVTDEDGRKYLGIERFSVDQIRDIMVSEINHKAELAKKQAEEKAKLESSTNFTEVQNG